MSRPVPRFVQAADVLTRQTAESLLLVSPGRQEVVALRGSGPEIWRLLVRPVEAALVVADLADRYGLPQEEIAPDVRETLNALVAADVVRQVAA